MSESCSDWSRGERPGVAASEVAPSGYVPRYGPCSVCGKDFPSVEELTRTKVHLFSLNNELRIPEWDSEVLQCGDCLDKFGLPVKVYHRPYESDVALFVKSRDLIVLRGQRSGD